MWGWGSADGKPVHLEELPSPKTRADYENLARQCLAELLELEQKGEDVWKRIPFECEFGEKDIQLFEKPDSTVNCIKVVGSAPCSPKALFELMCEEDLAKRQRTERDLVSYEIIEEVTEDIAVTRARYRAPFPVAGREIVTIRCRAKLDDGAYVSYGKSINHDKCLSDSNYVRAALHHVAAIYRPVPGNSNKCLLVRIAALDPKGNIPAFVVNATKQKAAVSLIILRKLIAENPHELAREEEENVEELQEDKSEELEQEFVEIESPQPVENKKAIEQPDKGKEKVQLKARQICTEPSSEGEMFYDTPSSLPWDDAPFREMYSQHRQEINKLVISLQASFAKLERSTAENDQRLRDIERLLHDQRQGSTEQRTRNGDTSLFSITNLSWGTIGFLVAWPFVAYSVYDWISTARKPKK